MKAIVLAAGIGSRLGELTRHRPKCLLPVAGRPLLDYWCESLSNVGVTDVYINTHHHAEQVRAFIESRPHGLKFVEGFEETLCGSGGTLRSAFDFVSGEDKFFIIYADNYAEISLARLLSFHAESGAPPIVVAAYPTERP
ncbi:MAG: nucleotidyltransferase family protein, partial [Calditrichaeota bacterium]|nr:nucleotidyltransferase family protein [Calditrichota bacterium]